MTTNQPTRTQPAHTPGPWACFNRDGDRTFKRWGVQGANGRRVCWVENARPQSEANARLIAAAPSLLEACKRVRDGLDAGEHPGPFASILDAAIARAEGGEG